MGASYQDVSAVGASCHSLVVAASVGQVPFQGIVASAGVLEAYQVAYPVGLGMGASADQEPCLCCLAFETFADQDAYQGVQQASEVFAGPDPCLGVLGMETYYLNLGAYPAVLAFEVFVPVIVGLDMEGVDEASAAGAVEPWGDLAVDASS